VRKVDLPYNLDQQYMDPRLGPIKSKNHVDVCRYHLEIVEINFTDQHWSHFSIFFLNKNIEKLWPGKMMFTLANIDLLMFLFLLHAGTRKKPSFFLGEADAQLGT
jgi:hypothetical protein